MFASKRTIGKQGLYPVAVKESHKIEHNNKGNKRGHRYYAQTVLNKDGKPVKSIFHIVGLNTGFKVSRVKKRLRKSMSTQPAN